MIEYQLKIILKSLMVLESYSCMFVTEFWIFKRQHSDGIMSNTLNKNIDLLAKYTFKQIDDDTMKKFISKFNDFNRSRNSLVHNLFETKSNLSLREIDRQSKELYFKGKEIFDFIYEKIHPQIESAHKTHSKNLDKIMKNR